jgi:AbrB family looped-hinge helix DNA binding protein
VPTTRLSSKGQVIIPKGIRTARGWEPGLVFMVEERGDGAIVLRPWRPSRTASAKSLLGCTGYRGPRRSLRDMDEAVAREARRRR